MTIASLDGPISPTPPTLAIVIVNFNSWPDSERLVERLAASSGPERDRFEVILVDNASSDPPPPGLLRRPKVRVIRRPDNAGFAAGVNTAWRETDARWLLAINPDIEVDPDLIGAVLGRIERFEGRAERPPGVVGFALENEDGTRQHSVGSFPTLLGCVREVFRPRSRRKYWSLSRTKAGPVPWVTGACMLVHASLMAELGGMDEEFFLYHEEVALCHSARRRGWSVEFDDAVAVRHLRPLQARAVSPVLRVVTRHSKLLYFLKFRPRWEFELLGRIVSAEARLRSAASRLLGRREEAIAWGSVARIARLLGPDRGPRGVEVLALAERAMRPGEPRSGRPGGGPRRPSRKSSPIRLDAIRRSR